LEVITLKFIDTSSKLGHGRFQLGDEKSKFYGVKAQHTKKEEKTSQETLIIT